MTVRDGFLYPTEVVAAQKTTTFAQSWWYQSGKILQASKSKREKLFFISVWKKKKIYLNPGPNFCHIMKFGVRFATCGSYMIWQRTVPFQSLCHNILLLFVHWEQWLSDPAVSQLREEQTKEKQLYPMYFLLFLFLDPVYEEVRKFCPGQWIQHFGQQCSIRLCSAIS